MDVYVKEMLHVLDYNNNIVDTIFNSDDHLTPGYAFNIVVKDSNTGYSDLSFEMPNTIIEDKTGNSIHNPKLNNLQALVKLRYSREVYYMGEEDLHVREPRGYGDTVVYEDVIYKSRKSYPENIIENYVMDYIVQPVDKKRNVLKITTTFTAIDYPRFTLSKKKVGLMIDDDTVTKPEWSLFSEKKPLSQPGTIKYIEWDRRLSETLYTLLYHTVPTDEQLDAYHAQKGSWNPLTATDYPLNKEEVELLKNDDDEWEYGFTATSFYWPVVKTGRYKGVLYEENDWIAFQGYDLLKLTPAGLDPDLYVGDKAWHWQLIKPIEDYVSPNGAENYLHFILDGTAWSVGEVIPETVTVYNPKTGRPEENKVERTCKLNFNGSNCYNAITTVCQQLQLYPIFDCINMTVSLRPYVGKHYGLVYRLGDNIKGDNSRVDGEKVITKLWVTGGTDNVGSSSINIGDAERGYIQRLQGFYADKASLDSAEKRGEWAIVDPKFTSDDFQMTDYKLENLEIITYPKEAHGFTVKNYWVPGPNREVYFWQKDPNDDNREKWMKGTKLPTGLWTDGGYIVIDPISGVQAPWDPNDPEYIMSRSPYWTNYILNFKWYYDNGWMTQEQILDLYQQTYQIYILNREFGNKYIEDRRATETEYNNAKNNYDIAEEGYVSTLQNMMNRYYKEDGIPEKGEVYCFHKAPQGVWLELDATEYDELPDASTLEVGSKGHYNNKYYQVVLNDSTKQWQVVSEFDNSWSVKKCKVKLFHCYDCGHSHAITADIQSGGQYILWNDLCYTVQEPAPVTTHERTDGNTCNSNDYEIINIDIDVFDFCRIECKNEIQKYPYGSSTSAKGYRYNPRFKGLYERLCLTLDQMDHREEDRWEIEDYEQHIYMTKDIDYDESTGEGSWFDEYTYKFGNLYVRSTSGQIENWNDAVERYVQDWGDMRSYLRTLNDAIARKQQLVEVYKQWAEMVDAMHAQIQNLYGDFIVEGKYQNTQQPYVSILFREGLDASDKYAIPEITYNLDVVDSAGLIEYRRPSIDKYICHHCGYISYRFPYYYCPACGERTMVRIEPDDIYNDLVRKLHGLGQIIPKAGDYVSIYDEPMGFMGIPGLITEIDRYLDDPIKNSIKLDTSYTNEEQLVGNIINATNTVLSNQDIYARTAYINADGTLDPSSLTNTLNTSRADISIVSTDGGILLDGSGLRCISPTDPSRAIKYTGSGIYATTTLDSENGTAAIWDALLTPAGINATYITSGTIDTNKLNITAGTSSKIIMDQFGLSVKQTTDRSYHLGQFSIKQAKNDSNYAAVWGEDNNIASFVGVDTSNQPLIYTQGFIVARDGSNIGNWITSAEGFYHLANDYDQWVCSNESCTYKSISYFNPCPRCGTTDAPLHYKNKDLWLSPTGIEGAVQAAGDNGSHNFALYANGNFGVTTSGVLYAKGAKINGTIEVGSDSTIGDWKVVDGELQNVKTKPTIVLSATGGAINDSVGAKYVCRSNGEHVFTSHRSLTAEGRCPICDGEINIEDSGSGVRSDWAFFANSNFGVTTSGNLYANNAYIKGTIYASSGIFNGTITAGSGRIGNWSISNGAISCGNTTLSSSGTITTKNLIAQQGCSLGNWSVNANGDLEGYKIYSNNKFTTILSPFSEDGLKIYEINDLRMQLKQSGLYFGTRNHIEIGGFWDVGSGLEYSGGSRYDSISTESGTLRLGNKACHLSHTKGYVIINAGLDYNAIQSLNLTNDGSLYVVAKEHITLHAGRDKHVYAGATGWNDGHNSQVETAAGTISSRSTKQNIKLLNNDTYKDALDLLKHMNLYSYDYKYDLYDNASQYGFILDEIEEEDKKHHFLDITNEQAWTRGRMIDFCMDDKPENDETVTVIDVKNYNRDAFTKYLLTCIKALQQEIEEIKKEKTN